MEKEHHKRADLSDTETDHEASAVKAAGQEHKNKQRGQNRSRARPHTHTHPMHDKGDTLNPLITNGLTNKQYQENQVAIWKNTKLDPYLTPHTRINSK